MDKLPFSWGRSEDGFDPVVEEEGVVGVGCGGAFCGCRNRRVSACSYSRSRPSWEVKRSTVSRTPPVSSPMVRIISRVSMIRDTIDWYLERTSGSVTWPSDQSSGACISAKPDDRAARR